MDSFLANAGGWAAGLIGGVTALAAFFKTPLGRWLFHKNVAEPARAAVASVVKDEIAPLAVQLDSTTTAFKQHMIEESSRLAVEAERSREATTWRRTVDGRMEDGALRMERMEAETKAVREDVAQVASSVDRLAERIGPGDAR